MGHLVQLSNLTQQSALTLIIHRDVIRQLLPSHNDLITCMVYKPYYFLKTENG